MIISLHGVHANPPDPAIAAKKALEFLRQHGLEPVYIVDASQSWGDKFVVDVECNISLDKSD